MRRLVEIFVGQNSMGDGYRTGGMVHVFGVVTLRRGSSEGNSSILLTIGKREPAVEAGPLSCFMR